MTQENPPSGEKPKKNTLKLLLRSKPTAEVETSAGRVYLYPLRVRDMTDFGKLEPGDAVRQIRAFLSSIGSLTLESDEAPERVPLDAAIAADLPNDEIERIADAYAQSSAWQTIREGSQERTPAVRGADETASVYLVRLLKAEVEDYHQSAKRLHESLLGSNRGLFDQMRKAYTGLGSMAKELESLARPALSISPSSAYLEANNHLAEHAARVAHERNEELNLLRKTAETTAGSAMTLAELAKVATTLMEQMDERDRRTDQFTRKQITIAVWSVGISAVLALFALIVSGFAYFQDQGNNTSGDQWQARMLTAIEQGNQQHSAVERENQALREKVTSLDDRIVDLETAQHAAVKSTSSKQKPD